MKQTSYSFLESRLIIHSPAFSALLKYIMSRFEERSLDLDRFILNFEEIVPTETAISPGGIYSKLYFNSSLQLVNNKNLTSKWSSEISITWNITSSSEFPAIKILSLDFDNTTTPEVNFSKLKFTLPGLSVSFLKDYLNKHLERFEDLINSNIKSQFSNILSSSFELPSPISILWEKRFLLFRDLKWQVFNGKERLDIDFECKTHVSTLSGGSNSEWNLSHGIITERSSGNSKVFYPITWKELELLLNEVSMPLDKLGHCTFTDVKMDSISNDHIHLSMNVESQINASVSTDIEIDNRNFPCFLLKNFSIEIENKILNFGISLLENKIAKSIQVSLNKYIEHQFQMVIQSLNERLNQQKHWISSDSGDLYESAMNINLLSFNSYLSLEIISSYFSTISIKNIPDNLLKV